MTRTNQYGHLEILHADLPKTFVRIFPGGKGFELYAESDGVAFTSIMGKSFKKPERARAVADKFLEDLAATRAEDAAQYAAAMAAGFNEPPPAGTYPDMEAVMAQHEHSDFAVLSLRL